MGLMVHSLEGIPEEHHRDYYIYLLDYGWQEPLSDILIKNFGRMAAFASEQKNAVVIMKTDSGVHFSDEVLSWHSINGDNADEDQLLPAILVTNRHPAIFRKRASVSENEEVEENLKLVLFPLKKHCKDSPEVITLIQTIFSKIKQGQDLDNFKITSEKKKGFRGAIAHSIILEPNFSGLGFSFNKFWKYLNDDKKLN
ncbi:hypothetical protein [Flavobacterium poyangense]|uniref:hypothetical protein n=1 Tax=Flavobacterium poyangense TaxID=2204302 RepID=UPI00141FF83C|nr:hypothetical protein [Flavobacterium sp. JXAS1]